MFIPGNVHSFQAKIWSRRKISYYLILIRPCMRFLRLSPTTSGIRSCTLYLNESFFSSADYGKWSATIAEAPAVLQMWSVLYSFLPSACHLCLLPSRSTLMIMNRVMNRINSSILHKRKKKC